MPVDKSGSEGLVDRKLASSPRVITGAHDKETLERKYIRKHLLLRSNHKQASLRRQHETQQYDTGLPSREITNKLSQVSVTHDDTAHLQWFKLFSYTT